MKRSNKTDKLYTIEERECNLEKSRIDVKYIIQGSVLESMMRCPSALILESHLYPYWIHL